MIRLVLSDLRDHSAIWVGAFAIAVACGYIGGWVASLQTTASFYTEGIYWSLQNAATMMLVFSLVAGVAVLVSAAGLSVSMQRRSYALWQLANVSPHKVVIVVLLQLVVVSFIGSLCGTLISVVTFKPLFPLVFSTQNVFDGVNPYPGTQKMPFVWFVVALLFLVGGMKGAVSAGRTPPLSALREQEVKRKGLTWFRVLLFFCLVLSVYFVYSIMASSTPYDSSSWAVLIPILLAAALTTVAPLVFSAVLTAWTSLVPQKRWNAWYLARHIARYNLSTSTSIQTPIMMGFAIVAGLFSVLSVFAGYDQSQGIADTSGWTLDLTTGLVVLGAPVFLCAIGAAVSVAMSSKSRTHDIALFTANGAQPSTLIASALCEALIHTVTASLVGMFSVTISTIIVEQSLGLPLFQGVTFSTGLVVSLVGFVLVLSATLLPTLSALKRDTAAVLAMQE